MILEQNPLYSNAHIWDSRALFMGFFRVLYINKSPEKKVAYAFYAIPNHLKIWKKKIFTLYFFRVI